MDIDMVDQTMLKPRIPLYGLFYFHVLELTLFALKFPLTQHLKLLLRK